MSPPALRALAEQHDLASRCPSDPRLRLPDDTRELPEAEDVPVAAQVTRDDASQLSVILYGWDPLLERWVRIGTADVGEGTQSRARVAAGLAVLPFAGVVDLAVLPLRLARAIVRVL